MSNPQHGELILIRYGGDLATKARATRRYFLQRLSANLKDALHSAGARGRVIRTHDRIFVEVRGPAPLEALARVFGVQSLSRVERRSWQSLEDLVASGVELFGDAVRGRRFAVRARRVGDRARLPVSAQDLERALGAALLPAAARVDLDDPELTVHVEVSAGRAHFFSESIPGRGGLPLGVEGRAVALVSGGFDSAVAVWQLMKRGVALDHVFCNLGGRSHQLGTLRVMKTIADRWCYGTHPHLHALDFEPLVRDLQLKTETRYWQILLKRLMLRAAARVAGDRRAAAIVTGEAVGQVSSQTLQNIAVISEAVATPILRPLVAFNKDEIIAIARDIGTFELSKVVREYCAIVPRKPATAAALEAIRAEEVKLDPEILDRAVAERSIFDLRTLDLDKLDLPELEVTGVPEGATLIDLRSKAAYREWHYPDALFLDFADALRSYVHFERGRTYVLYCEFGLKSAHLAELMRRDGYDAYHFRRGTAELLAHARERGITTP